MTWLDLGNYERALHGHQQWLELSRASSGLESAIRILKAPDVFTGEDPMIFQTWKLEVSILVIVIIWRPDISGGAGELRSVLQRGRNSARSSTCCWQLT